MINSIPVYEQNSNRLFCQSYYLSMAVQKSPFRQFKIPPENNTSFRNIHFSVSGIPLINIYFPDNFLGDDIIFGTNDSKHLELWFGYVNWYKETITESFGGSTYEQIYMDNRSPEPYNNKETYFADFLWKGLKSEDLYEFIRSDGEIHSITLLTPEDEVIGYLPSDGFWNNQNKSRHC